jgi:hypothetical protein
MQKHRKVAAILAADLVGHSELAGTITARANVSRAKRGRKITLPAIKFLDNHETDDQTDGSARAGWSPSGAAARPRK